MTTPEQTTNSPDVSLEVKKENFQQAGVAFRDVALEKREGQWRPKTELDKEQLLKSGKGLYGAVLGLKEEGRWDSLDEALDEESGINFEEIGYSQTTNRDIKALFNLLENKGITEKDLRETDQGQQAVLGQGGSGGGERDSSGQGHTQGEPKPKAEKTEQGDGQGEDEKDEDKAKAIKKKYRRREKMPPDEEEEYRRGEGGRGSKYYEYQRREAVATSYGLDTKKLQKAEIDPREVLESFTDPSERRRQYLTMVLGELINGGHFIERYRVLDMLSASRTNSLEGSMNKAAEYIQTAQSAASKAKDVEGFFNMLGAPSPEVFDGLRELTLKVEVKTKDGERYTGEISPLDIMDLIDSPEWSQRLMTNRRDDKDLGDEGYFNLRGDLVDECLCRHLKNERGKNLPVLVKNEQGKRVVVPGKEIVWTNLYDFPLMTRIDAESEQMDDVRDPLIGALWYLHEIGWSFLCVCGRQRAWDKALEGRWEFDYFRRPFLPANYDGILYNNGVWHTTRFLRIIQWYDLLSESCDKILPIFRARWSGSTVDILRQQDIISRKVLRRGALPHLEEEESKIALDLDEYSGPDWSEKAARWLNNEGNITIKGEMKSWEEMRDVTWIDEERRLIAEVDFRPALEMMSRLDPRVQITGDTKGVDGYQQVVNQLSYRNLDYSGIPRKGFLSEMKYTVAADNSYKIINGILDASSDSSGFGAWFSQQTETGKRFGTEKMESIKRQVKEFVSNQMSGAIGYADSAEKNEASVEFLWALAQGFNFYKWDWIGRIIMPQIGKFREDYVAADDMSEGNAEVRRILNERENALEQLGYQFIRIGRGNTRVFGPSGAPVKRLVKCSGRDRNRYYCPAYDQFGSRPLGWKIIGSVASALQDIKYLTRESADKAMKEIKTRVFNEFPPKLPKDEGIWFFEKEGIPGGQFHPDEEFQIRPR